MRQARLRGEGLSCYHCLSRVVDRRFIFGHEERKFAVALRRRLEGFLGLRAVTYAFIEAEFRGHVAGESRDEV